MILRRTSNHRISSLLQMSRKKTTILLGVTLHILLMMTGSFQQTRPSYVNENLYELVLHQPSVEQEPDKKQVATKKRRLRASSSERTSTADSADSADGNSSFQKQLTLVFRGEDDPQEEEEEDGEEDIASSARVSILISAPSGDNKLFGSDQEAQDRVNKLQEIIRQAVGKEFSSAIIVADGGGDDKDDEYESTGVEMESESNEDTEEGEEKEEEDDDEDEEEVQEDDEDGDYGDYGEGEAKEDGEVNVEDTDEEEGEGLSDQRKEQKPADPEAIADVENSNGRKQEMGGEKARQPKKQHQVNVASSDSPASDYHGEEAESDRSKRETRDKRAQHKDERITKAATSMPTSHSRTDTASDAALLEENKSTNYNFTDSVAGCLQIMDDNHFLVEWLSYHYHVMPLRRLIVFVDPQSKTSPEPILNRWRDRIDITVWNESRIFKTWPHVFPKKFNPTDKHRRRQRHFVYYCLKELHSEGREWAFHTDTDEYILINDAIRDPTKKLSPLNKEGFVGSIPDQEEHGSVLKLLRQEGIQTSDTKRKTTHDPCINLARKTFGTREYNTSSEELLLNTYNSSDFQTFNWRYYNDKPLPGKCLMNLQLIDPRKDIWDGNGIHKPLSNNLCGKPNQFPSAKEAPLVVNHYQGTLHQLLFRSNDQRGHLTNGTHYRIERFNTYKQYDQKIETPTIQKWLPGFVKAVGENTARDLLKDVGNPELAAVAVA